MKPLGINAWQLANKCSVLPLYSLNTSGFESIESLLGYLSFVACLPCERRVLVECQFPIAWDRAIRLNEVPEGCTNFGCGTVLLVRGAFRWKDLPNGHLHGYGVYTSHVAAWILLSYVGVCYEEEE